MLDLSAFEEYLASSLTTLPSPDTLTPAVHYSLFPGGKRLRPRLCLSMGRDLGVEDLTCLFGPAAALEMLHASSLIHDDLPALDNDLFRRGRPSCHAKFGEATALLAGDLLIAAAHRAVAETKGLTSDHVREVSKRVGIAFEQLCVGQQLDILPRSEGDLLNIYRHKTGALFGASLAAGAICADANSSLVQAAWNLGIEYGVLFQLVDDYQDLFGSNQERGRQESSDERNGRVTLFTDRKSVGEEAILEAAKRVGSYLISIHEYEVRLDAVTKILVQPVEKFVKTDVALFGRVATYLRGEGDY